MKIIRIFRILVALSVITLLTLFFLGIGNGLGLLARFQFMPSFFALSLGLAFWLAVSLCLGRIYCSWFCPLGILQDILIRITRRTKRRPFQPQVDHKWIRIAFFGVFVIMIAIGGSALAGCLDPYGIFGRIITHLVEPIVSLINNLLADLLGVEGPIVLFKREVFVRSVSGFVVALASFFLLAGMVAWRGRVFCTMVCPVGTFLGFLSRKSSCRLEIDHASCIKCGRCSNVCKTGCLDGKSGQLDNARCVRCFDCVAVCPKKAVSFGSKSIKAKDVGQSAAFRDRRSVLVALGAVGASLFVRREARLVSSSASALPPPGATVEGLRTKCLACGLCMSRCPRKVLVPAGLSDYGLLGLMMPKMDFAHGFCDPSCTICGESCPTGAIPRLTIEEKGKVKIGLATYDSTRCLVCTEKVPCGLCSRRCPNGAITLDKDGRPVVAKERCTGCGACENYCPTGAMTTHVAIGKYL